MLSGLGWGAFAASSLVIGAVLGIVHTWSRRVVGLVLAFGAGALISAVTAELVEEGVRTGGGTAVGIGLGAGALTYFTADSLLERAGRRGGAGQDGSGSGVGL